MTDFTMEKGSDGVAVITWDVPGKSMNVLQREAFAECERLFDEALADDAIRGIVITSGKDHFHRLLAMPGINRDNHANAAVKRPQ